jgi:uncharacterized protein with von Willebrand factor type A (vWA) domain
LVIAGAELERGIRQAMAREDVPSLMELARRSHIRRDTMYGWFRAARVRVSAGSVEKLASTLGTQPGDPWYEEPIERSLDPETRAMLDAAVDRAMDRLGDRLVQMLDRRLGRTGRRAKP